MACVAGGTLDIVYACVVGFFRGRPPMVVLQSVASGWQGQDAYSGGMGSALLGLVTHYGIMLAMATVFGLVAGRATVLRERPWPFGLAYGAALYVVMYAIVLPLRFPQIFPRFNGWVSVADVLVHMAVGVIIAHSFANRRSAGTLRAVAGT